MVSSNMPSLATTSWPDQVQLWCGPLDQPSDLYQRSVLKVVKSSKKEPLLSCARAGEAADNIIAKIAGFMRYGSSLRRLLFRSYHGTLISDSLGPLDPGLYPKPT